MLVMRPTSSLQKSRTHLDVRDALGADGFLGLWSGPEEGFSSAVAARPAAHSTAHAATHVRHWASRQPTSAEADCRRIAASSSTRTNDGASCHRRRGLRCVTERASAWPAAVPPRSLAVVGAGSLVFKFRPRLGASPAGHRRLPPRHGRRRGSVTHRPAKRGRGVELAVSGTVTARGESLAVRGEVS
jgi:hypothetical protein